MKNRTLPYGYQCCNGITVPQPQESEIVKRICESYLNGQSLLTIASWLNEEQIEYMPGVIGWNKARLKRIIEDERYLGKEPYPGDTRRRNLYGNATDQGKAKYPKGYRPQNRHLPNRRP